MMEELKSLSYSLISDAEVLIKGMTSLPVPVHQVYLHQVSTFKTNDMDTCSYITPLCKDLRAVYDVH